MTCRLALCYLLLVSFPLNAEQVLRSGVEQATLLELYTSEGCSSCPSADRWFTSLLDHPDLWRQLVPIAFHVDYWNYLGWADRFARPEFGDRQRQYRLQGNTNGVYTPGVVAAGDEWRTWRQNPDRLPIEATDVGVLELRTSEGEFTANFVPYNPAGEGASLLHVAVLGFGMSTPVGSGENRGRLLRHDFVVLGHDVFDGKGPSWSGRLPKTRHADQAQRLALVAWVSLPERLGPVQAVGAWL